MRAGCDVVMLWEETLWLAADKIETSTDQQNIK